MSSPPERRDDRIPSAVVSDAQRTGTEIIAACREAGFADAGVCSCEPSAWGDAFRAWLARGEAGSMGYLSQHVETRLDPSRLLDNARSVVMVADQYASRDDPPDPPIGARHGRIARYARGADYHTQIKKRLHTVCDRLRTAHPGHEFRAFTDTAPVLERELAQRAGLGWVAKHTLLISPLRGSYFFLGGFVTTLSAQPPPEQRVSADHCGTCTRCIDACPTNAITPYSVDASRCISYLTIERRLPIDERFHEPIGDWLFGCDICQEVCPHNRPADHGRAGLAHDAYKPARDSFDLLDVLGWNQDDRRSAFRSTALKRATLAMIKRNAIIVAGNKLSAADDPPLAQSIQRIAQDPQEPDTVRTVARITLNRLNRQ